MTTQRSIVILARCRRNECSSGSRDKWRSRWEVREKKRRSGMSRKLRIWRMSSEGKSDSELEGDIITVDVAMAYLNLNYSGLIGIAVLLMG